MIATRPTPSRTHILMRRVRLLSWLSVAWLLIDGAIGLTAGVSADSVVLIGWGLDCAIQSVASLALVWRFSGDRVTSDSAERLAQRIVGASFFLLAPYIVVTAVHHLATGECLRRELDRHRPSWC